MKRALTIIVFFIAFLLIYFLQTNFFNWYNIAGIQPNLFIILVLFIGLFLGRRYGVLLGIIFGFLLDLFIGKRIGFNSIMLGISGLIGGILDKSFSKESRITFMLMSTAVTILCEIINYTLSKIYETNTCTPHRDGFAVANLRPQRGCISSINHLKLALA